MDICLYFKRGVIWVSPFCNSVNQGVFTLNQGLRSSVRAPSKWVIWNYWCHIRITRRPFHTCKELISLRKLRVILQISLWHWSSLLSYLLSELTLNLGEESCLFRRWPQSELSPPNSFSRGLKQYPLKSDTHLGQLLLRYIWGLENFEFRIWGPISFLPDWIDRIFTLLLPSIGTFLSRERDMSVDRLPWSASLKKRIECLLGWGSLKIFYFEIEGLQQGGRSSRTFWFSMSHVDGALMKIANKVIGGLSDRTNSFSPRARQFRNLVLARFPDRRKKENVLRILQKVF